MHTIDFIAPCIPLGESPFPEYSITDGVCSVTGEFGPCVKRKLVIKDSFTNGDLLNAPTSNFCSVNACRVLNYKWERMSSWLCDGVSFRKITRQEAREFVLSSQKPERWAGYITTSYKKHGALWAHVNSGGAAIWRFEMMDVDCSNRMMMVEIWNRLNTEIECIGRSIMESLDCPPFLIKKIGIKRWMDFERWARPISMTPLYRLMCYLLPSQEEMKNGFTKQI